MKAPLAIVALVFAAFAAMVVLRQKPEAAAPAPATAADTEPIRLEPPASETVPKPVEATKNRFVGPHDGSHIYQGFDCPACKMQPLEY